nr:hypothetical protein CFP56_47288 [Quercus suber]
MAKGESYEADIKEPIRSTATLLWIIKVIHVALISISASHWRGILNITSQQEHEMLDRPSKKPRVVEGQIAFDDDDLVGTPHCKMTLST